MNRKRKTAYITFKLIQPGMWSLLLNIYDKVKEDDMAWKKVGSAVNDVYL